MSRLNAAAGRGAIPVAPEVAALLARSVALARDTRGSFDVTVGPLVALWREAAARECAAPIPKRSRLRARASGRIGSRWSATREARGAALAAGGAVDLGGVAKGYALDRVRDAARRRASRRRCLSFGQSSTWAIGRPPDSRRLAPARARARTAASRACSRCAIARSRSPAALGQWNEIGGRRYGHVIDPRSGEPLTRGREALVVTRDATLAEALSQGAARARARRGHRADRGLARRRGAAARRGRAGVAHARLAGRHALPSRLAGARSGPAQARRAEIPIRCGNGATGAHLPDLPGRHAARRRRAPRRRVLLLVLRRARASSPRRTRATSWKSKRTSSRALRAVRPPA